LTDSVLNDLPEPSEHEQIARVVATRGGNHFDVCLPHDDTEYLAILPTKFHKLVWVKRGDYVLVEVGDSVIHDTTADDPRTKNKSDDESGIRHMISHILYKDQVKHLKSKGLWPEDDPEFEKGSGAREGDDNEILEENDGIVYQEYDDDVDDDLFVNTNRIARLEIQESSDEDGSDDEE
jgi:probable RNA-binding protein EIF1AD